MTMLMLDGGVLDKVKDQPASELTDEKLICCQSRVRTGTPATPNDDDDDDDDGLPAYSHHDKIPPWWEYVSNYKGGNVSVSKSHHTG